MFFSAFAMAAALLAEGVPAAAPPAPAAAAPAAAAPAAAPAKTQKPKLICRTEPVLGSLFPKKTCYSEDELSQRKQAERQNLEQMQTQSHH